MVGRDLDRLVQLGLDLFGVGLAAGGVVMEGEAGALTSELAGDLGTEVLDTTGDESDLTSERHCGFLRGFDLERIKSWGWLRFDCRGLREGQLCKWRGI